MKTGTPKKIWREGRRRRRRRRRCRVRIICPLFPHLSCTGTLYSQKKNKKRKRQFQEKAYRFTYLNVRQFKRNA